jgi:hypothetical protein
LVEMIMNTKAFEGNLRYIPVRALGRASFWDQEDAVHYVLDADAVSETARAIVDWALWEKLPRPTYVAHPSLERYYGPIPSSPLQCQHPERTWYRGTRITLATIRCKGETEVRRLEVLMLKGRKWFSRSIRDVLVYPLVETGVVYRRENVEWIGGREPHCRITALSMRAGGRVTFKTALPPFHYFVITEGQPGGLYETIPAEQ